MAEINRIHVKPYLKANGANVKIRIEDANDSLDFGAQVYAKCDGDGNFKYYNLYTADFYDRTDFIPLVPYEKDGKYYVGIEISELVGEYTHTPLYGIEAEENLVPVEFENCIAKGRVYTSTGIFSYPKKIEIPVDIETDESIYMSNYENIKDYMDANPIIGARLSLTTKPGPTTSLMPKDDPSQFDQKTTDKLIFHSDDLDLDLTFPGIDPSGVTFIESSGVISSGIAREPVVASGISERELSNIEIHYGLIGFRENMVEDIYGFNTITEDEGTYKYSIYEYINNSDFGSWYFKPPEKILNAASTDDFENYKSEIFSNMKFAKDVENSNQYYESFIMDTAKTLEERLPGHWWRNNEGYEPDVRCDDTAKNEEGYRYINYHPKEDDEDWFYLEIRRMYQSHSEYLALGAAGWFITSWKYDVIDKIRLASYGNKGDCDTDFIVFTNKLWDKKVRRTSLRDTWPPADDFPRYVESNFDVDSDTELGDRFFLLGMDFIKLYEVVPGNIAESIPVIVAKENIIYDGAGNPFDYSVAPYGETYRYHMKKSDVNDGLPSIYKINGPDLHHGAAVKEYNRKKLTDLEYTITDYEIEARLEDEGFFVPSEPWMSDEYLENYPLKNGLFFVYVVYGNPEQEFRINNSSQSIRHIVNNQFYFETPTLPTDEKDATYDVVDSMIDMIIDGDTLNEHDIRYLFEINESETDVKEQDLKYVPTTRFKAKYNTKYDCLAGKIDLEGTEYDRDTYYDTGEHSIVYYSGKTLITELPAMDFMLTIFEKSHNVTTDEYTIDINWNYNYTGKYLDVTNITNVFDHADDHLYIEILDGDTIVDSYDITEDPGMWEDVIIDSLDWNIRFRAVSHYDIEDKLSPEISIRSEILAADFRTTTDENIIIAGKDVPSHMNRWALEVGEVDLEQKKYERDCEFIKSYRSIEPIGGILIEADEINPFNNDKYIKYAVSFDKQDWYSIRPFNREGKSDMRTILRPDELGYESIQRFWVRIVLSRPADNTYQTPKIKNYQIRVVKNL